MVDLDFTIDGVEIERHAMSPLLRFGLRVVNNTPERRVLSIMLSCQIRVEPGRRRYGAPEHERLSDLFGTPERWGQTLQSFLWTQVTLTVRGFDREIAADLPAPCSFDFNIAATKYFDGLAEGEAPLVFLFSGSVFYREPDGQLQIGQIAWTKESAFRLPVSVWRELVEHYYPQRAWLCLQRDAFDALYRYKRQHGLPSFERALEQLLEPRLAETAR
jgi:hypothetical protein